MTLLYGFPTSPSEIVLVRKPKDQQELRLFFVQNVSGVDEDPTLSEILVPLLSLTRRQREELFRSWFAARTPVRTAAELLCGTLFQQDIYTRLEFVNHVQTLEAFHRAVFRKCGRYLSPAQYEPIRTALINAIPARATQAHRAKLKSAINFGYEKAQRAYSHPIWPGNRIQIGRAVAFNLAG